MLYSFSLGIRWFFIFSIPCFLCMMQFLFAIVCFDDCEGGYSSWYSGCEMRLPFLDIASWAGVLSGLSATSFQSHWASLGQIPFQSTLSFEEWMEGKTDSTRGFKFHSFMVALGYCALPLPPQFPVIHWLWAWSLILALPIWFHTSSDFHGVLKIPNLLAILGSKNL